MVKKFATSVRRNKDILGEIDSMKSQSSTYRFSFNCRKQLEYLSNKLGKSKTSIIESSVNTFFESTKAQEKQVVLGNFVVSIDNNTLFVKLKSGEKIG